MGTIAVLAVLAVIVFFAAKSGMKHFRGEGGCCGGGAGTLAEEEKKLEQPVIGKKIMHIEGMHCVNCKNAIERQINRIEGASCKVDLKKKLAIVSYDRELDDEVLRRAVTRLDYQVTSIDHIR